MAVKPHLHEKELLAKIARGDERAFTILFQWYYSPLGEFVLKLTESLEITQEIIQDSFVKIWLRKETLPGIDNFSAYLYILCRNHAFAVLKKMAVEKRSKQSIEQYLANEMAEADYDNPADHYRSLIEDAVAKLPAQQQRVYRLSRYDRLKHDAIARELNISAETVKKHIQLAVKFIQDDVNTRMGLGLVIVLTTPLFIH
jgi:RNA polymerase sigma-70 factor (family 1)